MASSTLLTKSNLCRLCGEENNNGIDLYSSEDSSDSEQLYTLINTYLPLTVEDEDQYPKKICPGCHIQLEATKLFMDLIIEGQAKLRNLLKSQNELVFREEKERQNLELALQNHNLNASVETYTIQSDENGEKYVIQIYSDGPLFSEDHQLIQKVCGINKPKKRKGRPRKSQNDDKTYLSVPDKKGSDKEIIPDNAGEYATSRRKRIIKPPTRYEGGVEGQELTKILTDEGIIDDDFEISGSQSELEGKRRTLKSSSKTVIGKVINASEPLKDEEFVFIKNPRSNSKLKSQQQQTFQCNICKQVFQHYGRCETHKRSHKIYYRCQVEGCSFENTDKDSVVNHQQEIGHVGISAFEKISDLAERLILTEEADSAENISNAHIQNTNKKSIKCDKCDKEFTCKQNYEVHLKAVHDGEKPFKCKICNRDFAYAFSLKNHLIVHYRESTGNSTGLFRCEACKKRFNHPSSLRYHMAKEHSNQKFACIKCDKTFMHRQLLRRHQVVHSDIKPYNCKECNKEFRSRSSLAAHENVHKEIVKYVCPVCGNTYNQRSSLWIHVRIHNGTKPYECDVCKKAFSQKGNLINHKRTHTGEKPFKCTYCESRFTTSSQCKSHVRRHTGEKPFSCKHCPRKFRHIDTFKSHVRRHLGEKPYKCKFCAKPFPQQWSCTRHERIHIGAIFYKCETCDKGFSDRTNYNKHRKTHLRKNASPPKNTRMKQKTDSSLENNTSTSKNAFLTDEILDSGSLGNSTVKVMSSSVRQDENQEQADTDLQIQLLDEEGNSVNLITPDGKSIPIVSSRDEKFGGLLPDGTLVSFDLICNEQVGKNRRVVQESQLDTDSVVNLLDREIHYIEDHTNSVSNDNRPAFLSDEGKDCFITTFDENSF